MKNIFFYLIILVLESFTFQSKPTMKETIDFIIPKLTGRDVFCSGEVYLHDYNIKYYFDYKSNTLTKTINGTQYGKPIILTTYIVLKNLNPENIKVSEIPTCGDLKHINIDISTTNNLENISCKEKYSDEEIRYFKAKAIRLQVPFENEKSNPDISNRLVKALKNAIILAGGKNETF